MKICYLNYEGLPTIKFAARDRNIGGLNTIVYNLIQNVSRLPEVNAYFVCRQNSVAVAREDLGRTQLAIIESGPIRSLEKDEQLIYLADYSLKVKKLFNYIRPDIVHTSGSEAGAVMTTLREQGISTPWVHTNYATIAVRKVLTEQADFVSLTNASEIVKRELGCLSDCDHIIALSEIDAQEISGIFRINKNKISYVYPGVDRQIFYPDYSITKENLIISAGRLSPIKDYPFIFKTFKSLLDLSEGWRKPILLIIGGNSQERMELGLKRLIDDFGIAKQVMFSDALPQVELADCFRRSKIFVGHSKHETFGLLPVEARACGLPTIVRNNSSYVVNVPSKFISPNDSELDMAVRIKEILESSREQWLRLSQESIDSASVYDWLKAAKGHHCIYEKVIKKEL